MVEHSGLVPFVLGGRRRRRAAAALERRAARNAPHQSSPAPRQVHLMPLEPRIMMDAVLDFGADATLHDLGGTAAVSSLLHTAINLVEEMDAFSDLLTDELTDAMGSAVDLFSAGDVNSYVQDVSHDGTGAKATDDTFAELKAFGTEVGDQLLSGIKSQIVTALTSVKGQMTSEINTYLDAQLTAYQATLQSDPDGLYYNRYEMTSAELTTLHNSVAAAVGGLTYDDILDPRAAFAEILGNAGQQAQSLALGPKAVPDAPSGSADDPAPPTGSLPDLLTSSEIATEVVTLKSDFIDKIAAAVVAPTNFDTSLSLVDIKDGANTLVHFAQTDGATHRQIDVTIDLTGLIPDLDSILDTLGVDGDSFGDYAAFKTAYDATFDDLTLGFHLGLGVTNGAVITADPDAGTDDDDHVDEAVYHKNFTLTANAFTTSFGFGGSIDTEDYLADLNISAGLFSAGITSIDLATFGLDFGSTAFALSFSTQNLNFTAAATDADNHAVSYGGSEAHRLSGDHPLTDFNFVDVNVTEAGGDDGDDDSFKYASLGFSAAIDWGVVEELNALAPGYSISSVHVDGSLALVEAAGAFSVVASPLVVKAYDGTTEVVEVTTPTPTQDAQWDALQTALGKLSATITALMDFDSEAYVDVLANLGSGLDALFESSLFDIDLPFLDDFHLSDVLNAYQAFTDALLEPMHAGLEVIGLSEGNAASVAGIVLITGIVVDDVDGTVLDALGGQTVEISLVVNSQTASTTDASTATVADSFTAEIDVPVGGFATLEDLAAAITQAFSALGSAALFGSDSALNAKSLTSALSISAVRGAIELRAGSGINSFTLGGDEALLSALGVVAKNNVASFHAGGTEDLVTLSLSDLTSDAWLKLFTLNLELTRTVTFSDNSVETIAYKTLTLSPVGGEWTVEDLKAQLNELFEAADIHMSVEDGDDPDTLKFHVDDTALTAVGTETGKVVSDVSYGFAIDGANASFASSVEVMQAFVTNLLDDFIPGAEFVIDIADGTLKLVLPEIAFAYETDFGTQQLGFDVGALGSLDLEAQFALFARMSLGLTIGVDIVGYADAIDPDLGLADFIFLEDAHLDVAVGASAQAISGTGILGVIEVNIGDPDADPEDNSVAVGAALHVALVGEDADGVYSNRLSFDQLWEDSNSQTGIAGMIGAFALTGTVGPDTDKFAYVALNDVRVGITGVNIGIEESVINAFTASLGDLRHPTDWETNVDSDVADLFESFGKDDVIDSLYNSLVLINQVLSGLVDNMSFLGEEIPVLGVSFIDAMNFTEDLAAQLQAFKDDPNGSLAEIGDALRSALGITDPNDLLLHWDATNKVFWVSLGLSFLDGAEVSYDFTLDLVDLLGGLLTDGNTDDDGLVSNLLDLVSSVANVTGEGTIILDAGVGFNLTFGIDLSSELADPDPVTVATALGALASVSQITFNTLQSNNKGNDVLLSVKRFDGSTDEELSLKVDLDGCETVGDALSALLGALEDAGLDDEIGIVVYDADGNAISVDADSIGDLFTDATEIASIGFVDLVAAEPGFNTDYAAVEALFGSTEDLVPDGDGKITGTVDLADTDAFDPTEAHSFALVINGAEPIVVTVGAWVQPPDPDGGGPLSAPGPRDLDGFIAELQQQLASQMVSRVDLGLGSFGSIPLDKLVTAALVADGAERHLELTLTNYAEIVTGTGAGDDFEPGAQIELTLTGLSKGAVSVIKLEGLGGSNLAAALGFPGDDSGPAEDDDGSLEGAGLVAKPETGGGISAFFATEDVDLGVDVNGDHQIDENDILRASGVTFTFTAGVSDGLNMTLAMGPLSVSVVDGHALISGDLDDPSTPATVHFGFNDAADGTEDGRFELSAVADAFGGGGSISDLFTLTAEVYLSVLLPLQDSLGLLDPTENRIEIEGTLLTIADGEAEGVLPALADPDLDMADYIEVTLDLPDFASILADLNPFAILNDPLLLTSGLDMILGAIDKTLRKVIDAMDLPIVGDSMMQGLDVFNDIRNAILQPILAAASTPDPITGELPTTIELLENVVNDVLKDLFGLDESDPDIISAFLFVDPDNAGANPVLYAEIAFNYTVFSAALDVGFDLGVPGFDLTVGEASALTFEVIADLHIGFGLDRNGFFFLNDTDNKEISLTAVVSTSDGFAATAALGVVGLNLTANAIEDEDYAGAMISGTIGIDLFTKLGTGFGGDPDATYEDDGDTAEDDFVGKYEKIVRLDQISNSKADPEDGFGTKAVAISGEFAVHVNFAVTTSVTNPITGDVITALPSAFADFVLDASYAIGGELEFERMEFQNLGLDAGDFLKENVLPVLNQIATYIEPIHDAVSFLETTKIGPYSLYDIIEQTLMTAGGPAAQSALFIFKAATTISQIIEFINDIGDDGKIYFGTFSLLSAASATGVVDVSDTKQVSSLKPTGTASSSFSLNAAMQNRGPGITFDLKIFDDVSNVLNLITGNLAEVDLFQINLTLLDFTLNIDLKATIQAAISFIPDEIIDALLGGMNASFYIHAEAGMSVGYDLYGIANFLESGDASDIIDGIYFVSDEPLLEIEASFNARVGVNFWIIQAGLELGGYVGASLSLNDPNNDGKMRFSEIAYVIDHGSFFDLIEGEVHGGIYMSVYYEIDFFFFDVSDSFELFSYDFSASFGKDFNDPVYLDVSGTTATFNVGAKAGDQIGGDTEDGDDSIVFNGDGTVTINGHTTSLEGATNFVIYAGDGDNFIDFSKLGAGFSVQYVSGSGNDTVIAGDVGGIISTGDGDDTITYAAPLGLTAFSFIALGAPYGPGSLSPYVPAPTSGTAPAPGPMTGSAYSAIKTAAGVSGAGGVDADGVPKTGTQTLLINTGDGHDTVDMAASDQGIVVISGGDLEITDSGKRVLLSDWLLDTYQGNAPVMADVLDKIEPELARYTALWQTKGDDTGDSIITGSGNDLVFAGNGDDDITTGDGDDQVYAGGGNDTVDVGADNDWVEGGAGADVIIGGDGADVLFGWSRFDETTTLSDFEGLIDLSHVADGDDDGSDTDAEQAKALDDFVELANGMMVDDESDWIEGNAGDDIQHGNGASDILQGNDGDDLMFGGADTDIMAGGSVTVTKADNTVLDRSVDLSGVYTVSTDIGADSDGADHMLGQGGHDVMVGGSGNDTLEGGDFFNALIGDFADLKLSGTSLLEVNATGIDNDLQGDDLLIGGSVNDVLMGNGGRDTLDGGMGRNVLIGDNARLGGTNIFKGVESMVSLYDELDDADAIYTGLTQSLIVAGSGGMDGLTPVGDSIQTGLSYGNLSEKAERMIIFADYGDLHGPQNGIGTLTTTFSVGDADTVITTDGDDIIFGGVGADTISAGLGDDSVFGDTGTYRTMPTNPSADGYEVRLGLMLSSDHDALSNPANGGASSQSVVGNDQIAGGDGNNLIIAGGGADRISTGIGIDVIVGDLGSIRIYGKTSDDETGPDIVATGSEPGEIVADDLPEGGSWDDTVIAGLGDDIVIGGDGEDVIAGGATDEFDHGRLLAMGDFGSVGAGIVDVDGKRVVHDLLGAEGSDGAVADPMARLVIMSANSSNPGKGGADELYGGADEDILIGGDAGDLIYGYGGDDLLFGDHIGMSYNPADGSLEAGGAFPEFGGDDEIHGGTGNDIAAGGFGDDLIYGDEGNDLLFGDHVRVNFGAGAGGYKIGSVYSDIGGNDTIHGGADNDIAVGQAGDDLLLLEEGNDIGAGDAAFVDMGARTLTTADPDAASGEELAATAFGGIDLILGGDGDDVLIGGREGDMLVGNGGGNVILGDYSDLSWFGTDYRLSTIVLAADQISGDDTIYLNNDTDPDHASGSEADASSIGVGQRGADSIEGGAEADMIAGDWVTFLLRDPAVYPGSAFERLITVESINNWIKDDDYIESEAGRDIVIAGNGDDYVDGGEGQDLIAGDEAVYTRYFDDEDHELLESRFPFEGGDDVIKGGPGNDMIISGYFNFPEPGAGDLIYGDTIEDFLMAGAGSLYIHNMQVERFNYLGLAPADNISNRQLSASAGVQLRPDYERDQFAEDERPSPFELSARDLANMLKFEHESPIKMPSVAEVEQLDALLAARILSDEVLHLIELYRQGAISLADLDAELREALVAALFDAYGYRLPEPIANMLDRYLELLYERLDIDAAPADDQAAAETTEFARRFAAAFDAA